MVEQWRAPWYADRFTVHTEYGDTFAVVHPNGELDLASRDVLRESLAALDRDVVIDLTGVSFLDSSGVAVLVAERERLTESGWHVRVVNPNDRVYQVLALGGLDDWIEY